MKLSGFDIRIDPSWILIAALVTWSLGQHVFPAALPGMTWGTYTAMAVIAMLVFFASLVGHELAHAVTARRFGVETRHITLFLFGGVAELVQEPKQARQEFWIAAAGPAMSLALAFGFWTFARAASVYSDPSPLTATLDYLALINLVLALFNLLPAFPLDGGRILRAWLWHRKGDILAATEKAAASGSVLAYMLIGLGVLSLFQGGIVGGFWNILIGFFLLAAARGSVEAQRIKSLLGNSTVRDLMTVRPITADATTTLSRLVNQVILAQRIGFVPVVDQGVLLGHIDTSVITSIDRENWANTTVGDVFVDLDPDACVSPDMAIPDLFQHISRLGQRKFMVVDDRTLLGVITLSDLTRHMGLLSNLGAGREQRGTVHPTPH
ncbi:MAG: site-2 protease family protein [Tateyamaria sp.]